MFNEILYWFLLIGFGFIIALFFFGLFFNLVRGIVRAVLVIVSVLSMIFGRN